MERGVTISASAAPLFRCGLCKDDRCWLSLYQLGARYGCLVMQMGRRSSLFLVLALLVALFGTALALLRSPRLVDGLLWRLERFESAPVLGQRVFERKLLNHHLVQDALIEPGSLLLFGDSHLAALPPSQLGAAHNFAVGGESAARLAIRLPGYRSLERAAGVVLGAGTNDLAEGASIEDVLAAWDRLLVVMPRPQSLLCVGVPQPGLDHREAAALEQLNRGIAQRCESVGAQFLAITPGTGAWSEAGWAPDGVHLNLRGSRHLIESIRAHFKQHPGNVAP